MNSNAELQKLKENFLQRVPSYDRPHFIEALQTIKSKNALENYKKQGIAWYKNQYGNLDSKKEFNTFTNIGQFLEWEKKKLEEYVQKYPQKRYTTLWQFVEDERKIHNTSMDNSCPAFPPDKKTNPMGYRRWKTNCAGSAPAAGGKRKSKTRRGKKSRRVTRRRR